MPHVELSNWYFFLLILLGVLAGGMILISFIRHCKKRRKKEKGPKPERILVHVLLFLAVIFGFSILVTVPKGEYEHNMKDTTSFPPGVDQSDVEEAEPADPADLAREREALRAAEEAAEQQEEASRLQENAETLDEYRERMGLERSE
jgi:hypothetical protein